MMQTNIPGIDQARGLASVRGNMVLYEKLLKKFYEQYHGATADLKQLINACAIDDAKRAVHSIKGVAGSLGALRLQEESHQLEMALDRGAPDLDHLLIRFEDALDEILSGLVAL